MWVSIIYKSFKSVCYLYFKVGKNKEKYVRNGIYIDLRNRRKGIN